MDEIAALNRIRRAHPVLQSHLGLTFHAAANDQVLLYAKRSAGGREIILVAVSLDPRNPQDAAFELPSWPFGLPDHAAVLVRDLMRNEDFVWYGKCQSIRLDPAAHPFFIWRLTAPGAIA